MTTFFEIGVCPRPDLSSLFQYTSPTPVVSPHLILKIQYHPGIPVTLLTGSSFHTFSSVLTGTSIVNAVKNNYRHRQTALGKVNSPLCTDAPPKATEKRKTCNFQNRLSRKPPELRRISYTSLCRLPPSFGHVKSS